MGDVIENIARWIEYGVLLSFASLGLFRAYENRRGYEENEEIRRLAERIFKAGKLMGSEKVDISLERKS